MYAFAHDGTRLYAAGTAGLHESLDAGGTWQDRLTTLDWPQRPTITALAVRGNTLLAGATGGVLLSEDGGISWTAAGLPTPPPVILAVAISPDYERDGTLVAASAEDGVFVSTDRGASWTPWNFGLVDLNIHALAMSPDFGADRTLLIGTDTGIYRSRDGGRRWQELPFLMDDAPVNSLAIRSAQGGMQHIYAGTQQRGLFLSDDGGAHWWHIDGAGESSAIGAIHLTGNRALWLLLEDALLYSPDGGNSWSQSQIAFPPGDLPLAMLPDPKSSDAGVLVGFSSGELLTATV